MFAKYLPKVFLRINYWLDRRITIAPTPFSIILKLFYFNIQFIYMETSELLASTQFCLLFIGESI